MASRLNQLWLLKRKKKETFAFLSRNNLKHVRKAYPLQLSILVLELLQADEQVVDMPASLHVA